MKTGLIMSVESLEQLSLLPDGEHTIEGGGLRWFGLDFDDAYNVYKSAILTFGHARWFCTITGKNQLTMLEDQAL